MKKLRLSRSLDGQRRVAEGTQNYKRAKYSRDSLQDCALFSAHNLHDIFRWRTPSKCLCKLQDTISFRYLYPPCHPFRGLRPTTSILRSISPEYQHQLHLGQSSLSMSLLTLRFHISNICFRISLGFQQVESRSSSSMGRGNQRRFMAKHQGRASLGNKD